MAAENEEEKPVISGNIQGDSGYQVGYGKPPIETRFGQARAPRRGTKPKSFDALRQKTVKLLNELAIDAKGNPILINGRQCSNIELILHMKLTDKKYQKDLLELAYGKVPDEIQGAGGGAIKHVIEVEYVRDSKV